MKQCVLCTGHAAAELEQEEALPDTPQEQPQLSRLAVKRWVLVQQVLWRGRQLTTSQLRYLTLCGLTWLLSDEVLNMSDEEWRTNFCQLAALVGGGSSGGGPLPSRMCQPPPSSMPPPLKDWLQHQKALRRLGTLLSQVVTQLHSYYIWQLIGSLVHWQACFEVSERRSCAPSTSIGVLCEARMTALGTCASPSSWHSSTSLDTAW